MRACCAGAASRRRGCRTPPATPASRRTGGDVPRVELTKEYSFEAAHRLPNVPKDHKCYRMHGHSFRVEIVVAGDIDPKTGWLVDFGDITAVVEPLLKSELDHRSLNDVPGLQNPTSEMLCLWL